VCTLVPIRSSRPFTPREVISIVTIAPGTPRAREARDPPRSLAAQKAFVEGVTLTGVKG
jgi:hypothetical protein